MKNGVAYIAPDSTNVAPGGRRSVRLQSTDSYTEVLILADFAHLPEAYLLHDPITEQIKLTSLVPAAHGLPSGLRI